jgi:hypothetical protein
VRLLRNLGSEFCSPLISVFRHTSCSSMTSHLGEGDSGRFLIGDVQPDPERYDGWGLQVAGRGTNGGHLSTGPVHLDEKWIDGPYLSPMNH